MLPGFLRILDAHQDRYRSLVIWHPIGWAIFDAGVCRELKHSQEKLNSGQS
jgi:hypothetical protein